MMTPFIIQQRKSSLPALSRKFIPHVRACQTRSRLLGNGRSMRNASKAMKHGHWKSISTRPSNSSHIKIGAPGDPLNETCFDTLYLRDSCTCPRCVNVSTRQKLFETSEVPLGISVRGSRWLPEGGLEVCWDNDICRYVDHRSVFSREFLNNASSLERHMRASYNFWDYVAWNRNMLERNLNTLHFQYQDYMGNAGTLQQLVNKLHSFGLAFIDAVPPTETAIRGLAERIGPLKHTFYGETWDVKSTPSPINVAYTADDLDFHMDLLYMVDPPYVQLLHCIKQSTQGGESRFADGVRAFERLQTEHPELVQPLVEFPITYYYKNNGHWFQKTRRFIEGGSQIQSRSKPEARRRYEYPKDYETINWSPPFQGPLEQVDPTNRSGNAISVGRYVEAANAFKRLLCEESAVFETKLEEGTCVVFNNRRVLHARRPFSNEGGERWLKGCYVDGDYLRDRFRVFAEAGSEGKT